MIALSGYLPVVRNSGNDWTTSAAPYPGDGEGGDGMLPGLLAAMRGETSLGLSSLRARVLVAGPPGEHGRTAPLAGPEGPALRAAPPTAHYGLLRYDALGTGRAALIALNFGAARATVRLDLSGLPPQVRGPPPPPLTHPPTAWTASILEPDGP